MATGAVFAALSLGVVPGNWGGGAGSLSGVAHAQQNFGQRVVNGVTENSESVPLAGATVFLRNGKSKAIRSYTTPADGHFRFAQVNMSDDFELWAEKDGKKSAVKTISTWDTRKEVSVELKLK
jgi:hypothetical protein